MAQERGTVTYFNAIEGFGFIAQDGGKGPEVYFRIERERPPMSRREPQVGDKVRCRPRTLGDGRRQTNEWWFEDAQAHHQAAESTATLLQQLHKSFYPLSEQLPAAVRSLALTNDQLVAFAEHVPDFRRGARLWSLYGKYQNSSQDSASYTFELFMCEILHRAGYTIEGAPVEFV